MVRYVFIVCQHVTVSRHIQCIEVVSEILCLHFLRGRSNEIIRINIAEVMGVLKVHDLMRISCGLCLVPVELNLLVLLMFAVHKTQMGQSKCFQCLSVSVLPWDDGCNSTSRCCRGSSLSLCQSLDTDDKIASFFFLFLLRSKDPHL